MSLDGPSPLEPQTKRPLDRARDLSAALADAARRARFSTRSRKRLTHGGFQGRRGESAIVWVNAISFVLMVLIPSFLGIAYYGFIASDQYVADMKFTVSGSEPPLTDGIGAITGIPALSIIQDTQIVVNHLKTRAAIEALDQRVGLRKLYSRDSIDALSRFNPEKPIEKLVRYWSWKHDVSIKMPAGIVEVRVRAFTPEDAHALAQAVLQISEELINDLNERLNSDAVRNAEQDVERASKRLMAARLEFERVRNEEGILDVAKTAEAIGGLIVQTRQALLELKQEYETQLQLASTRAPQVVALKARITVTEKQLAELEGQLTSATGRASDGKLSAAITRFSELELERQISERIYAGAVATLELARIAAERKRMYLNTFLKPAMPQEPLYPLRGLMIFGIVIGSLALWGMLVGTISLVRNHMA